jgi:hypothetical protein
MQKEEFFWVIEKGRRIENSWEPEEVLTNCTEEKELYEGSGKVMPE